MAEVASQLVVLASLDGGVCCFAFLVFSLFCVAFISNLLSKRHKSCRSCSQSSPAHAKFCQACGKAFDKVDGRKFYHDLSLRIKNWHKWGWLEEGEQERLVALHDRDLDIYDGREKIPRPKATDEGVEPAAATSGAVPGVEQVNVDGGAPPKPTVELPPDPKPVGKERAKVQPAATRVVKEPTPVAEMKPPRKLSDILQTFMDESNIKVGEFVSGLLIIVGSIGLVVTLNVQFQDRVQYLPAAVFMTVVVLFHVAGLYSLHKWNLAASSKVVLYIGSLLIPLNMLAATMRDTLPNTQGWMFYLAVLVGAGGFGALSFYGAKALNPRRWWPMMLVVLGPTLMQTVIKLVAAAGGLDGILAVNVMILIPLAMVALGVLAEHRVFRTIAEAGTEDAVSLLRVLTLGIFSVGVCVAVVFLKMDETTSFADICRYLANPFMILSFVIVSAGMLLHRRMEDEAQVNLRLVGTWMAIVGCLGVLGAFALAVPDINSMLVVSLVGSGLALAFGRVTRIPFLATTGTIGLGLAGWCVMTKTQVGTDHLLTLRQLWQFWFDGTNSLLLSGAALLGAGLHASFLRRKNEADQEFARYGFLGVVVTAAIGVLIAVYSAVYKHGEPGTDYTVIVFGFYAITTLVAAVYLPYKQVIIVATALIPITWLQAVNTSWFTGWNAEDGMGKFGIAVFATTMTYVLALIGYWIAGQREIGLLTKFHRSWSQWVLAVAAFVTYLLAAIYTVGEIYWSEALYQEAFVRSLILIAVTVVVAIFYSTDWTWMFVQIQAILAGASAVTLAWALQHPEMGLAAGSHVRAQLIGLSVGMLFWVGFRKFCQQSSDLRKFLVTDLMYVDFVLQVIATVVMYFVWLSSLLPAMALTYGADSVVANIAAHMGHTINYWDWILWAVTLAAWVSVVPDRHRRVSSCCILVVLSGLPVLASDRLVQVMAADVEAASHFLRWGYGFLGIGMALIVCTDKLWWDRLVTAFPRFMDNQDAKSSGEKAVQTWAMLRVLAFLAAAVPVIALTIMQFIHVAGIYFKAAGGQFDVMAGGVAFFEQYPSLAFAGPLWLIMLSTWIYGVRTARPGYLLLGLPCWMCGWMVCGLMSIWLDTEVTHFGELVHGVNWFLIGLALYVGAWCGAQWFLTRDVDIGEERVAKWQALFQVSSAPAIFLRGLAMFSLFVYGCFAMIDGFVLVGGLDASAWSQRAEAFGDLEAFVAVFILAVVLRTWLHRSGLPVDKILVITLFLTLNALFAHSVAIFAEVGEGVVRITQVLFSQNLGWTLLFMGTVLLIMRQLASVLKGAGANSATDDSGMTFVFGRAESGMVWPGVANLLSLLVVLGTAVLLRSQAHNDWSLIANVGVLAAMWIVLAGLLQDELSMAWAVILTLAAVALGDIQLRDSAVHLIAIDTRLVSEHLGYLARTECAVLALISVALGLAGAGADRVIKRRENTGALLGRTANSLLLLSVSLLTIFSVLGVVSEMTGSGSRWIDGGREIANLGIPLACLILLGRDASLQLVKSLYGWGVALFATLLAMWMADTETAFQAQVNSLQILYAVTAYLVVWALIYRFEQQVATGLTYLFVDRAEQRLAKNRLVVAYCQGGAGIAVVVASVVATFFVSEELLRQRYLVALLPLALAFSLECLRGTTLEKDRRGLLAVFCLVPLVGVLWADLGPGHAGTVWLSRLVRFFAASSALSVVVSYLSSRLAKRWPDWLDVSKKVQLGVVVAAWASLLLTLIIELSAEKLASGMSDLEVFIVCLGLIGLAGALLLVALKPDRDPLALSDNGRQAYVYLSELMILVLALHIWKCRPEWFGAMQEVWPYVLFVIAFVGAFASEYLRRSDIPVLSEPIHNTSFLLPAVPILALVLFKDEMRGTVADYQWFFFLAALVNVVMAFFRRSFLHAMVAALAGNASLWSVFAGLKDFGFVDHPQFWLIPPAVSVLIAGQLNKKQLGAARLSFLRYATIAVIYLASSSEMVLKWSLAQEGVQALAILAGLSLLGMAVGMLYRIRQFVYLGLGFFLLSMGGSVAKVSSYNQLWFWLALVVFGAIMLVGFAAREKYLPVLRAKLEEMEQWDKVAADQDDPA